MNDPAREAEVNTAVDGFFREVYSLNMDAASALMSDDAAVWHNYDAIDQPKADVLAAVKAGIEHMANVKYEVIRRYITPEGCMQQLHLQLTAPDGSTVSIHTAHRIVVEDGLITHIDEYLAPPV